MDRIKQIAFSNKKKAMELLDKYKIEYDSRFDYIKFYIDEEEYTVNIDKNRVFHWAKNTELTLLKFLKQLDNEKITNI